MITEETIDNVLTNLKTDLVLVDVGASGSPPDLWKRIAKHSIYVGFDPDLREMNNLSSKGFKHQIIINKAVTSSSSSDAVKFYLTRSPFCSSTLLPHVSLLSKYAYADLFDIVGETEMVSTSLNNVLREASLHSVDWLKVDTQGTDLRIVNSLSEDVFAHLLAIDIEPGLQQNYVGEDVFSEVHQTLTDKGFWLSDMAVRGAVRMQRSTIDYLSKIDPGVSMQAVEAKVRPSPLWVEARYLRTLESVADSVTHQRDLAVLWLFSLLDDQLGYASDIAVEYEQRYGKDILLPILQSVPLHILSRIAPITSLKALVPGRFKRWIRSRIR